MFGYYISLALRSLRGTPILSSLMVAAIAVGVGASMTVLTLNYTMSQNALKHKDDVLFAVQLDSWDVNKAYKSKNEIPWQLTYRDAEALLRSDIPPVKLPCIATVLPLRLKTLLLDLLNHIPG
ncbi:hypothetical protein QT397_07455 [Microbulbifer sp. MKSA007]|nr:hypothetical protein QT397_07455 [Microbulbifer sp. MKSA007]